MVLSLGCPNIQIGESKSKQKQPFFVGLRCFCPQWRLEICFKKQKNTFGAGARATCRFLPHVGFWGWLNLWERNPHFYHKHDGHHEYGTKHGKYLMHSTHVQIDWFVRSFIHSLIHSLIDVFLHSFIFVCLIYPFTCISISAHMLDDTPFCREEK